MSKLVEIEQAIISLKEGKTLLYPTDTIWGIGCDATREDAIHKIEEIKNRPKEKSFILLVESVAMLERYVKVVPDVCYDLIDLTEKPLTIIYDSPIQLPSSLLAADGSIGIRVTKDPICRKLIQAIRKPLVSTSANLSGEKTPSQFSEIREEIKNGVDFILNARMNEKMSAPSSILKIGNDGRIKVIR